MSVLRDWRTRGFWKQQAVVWAAAGVVFYISVWRPDRARRARDAAPQLEIDAPLSPKRHQQLLDEVQKQQQQEQE